MLNLQPLFKLYAQRSSSEWQYFWLRITITGYCKNTYQCTMPICIMSHSLTWSQVIGFVVQWKVQPDKVNIAQTVTSKLKGFRTIHIYLFHFTQNKSIFILIISGINVHEGMNVGMHAGLALLICFTILGSCAFGVNVIHRNCKCARID